MDREAHRVAKAQLVAQMQAGRSWHEAATSVGVQTSRASAYRLLRRVRLEGAVALDDQRHGHPTKVRQPVRNWLAAFCRAAPASPGRTVQAALLERFSLQVSVSQINRLRTVLGVRRQVSGAGEKSAGRTFP
jgi:transposase